MIVGVLIILALSITLVVLAAHRRLGLQNLSTWADLIQAVATSVGIAVAGYLYFAERRPKPHADVTQTVQAIALPHDVAMIEASVVVKNLGQQLLTVDHVRSGLQLVDLDTMGLPDLPSTPQVSYWVAEGSIGGEKARAFAEAELQWPQLRFYDGKVHHEVEPGESDLITVTYLIPCPSARYVRVASDVTKQRTDAVNGDSKTLVWKGRTIVDLDPVCRKGT